MDKVETLNNKGIFMDNRTLLEKLSSRTWSALIPICLICLSFYLSYQEQIFPTISTPITVNQQQAISMALSANQVLKLKLNPKSVKATSAFVSRHDMQNYISLRGGGNKKLNELIKQGTFINSFWSVRLYIPKEIQENHFYFTSDGAFYGYQIDIPEDTLLPNISQSSAEKKVRRFIHKHPLAHTNFDQYTLKDYTSSTQDNGRIDHTFIFSSQKNAVPMKSLQKNNILHLSGIKK